MTVHTVLVEVTLATLAPCVGARVTAVLTRADRDLHGAEPTWIFPEVVSGTTNADGVAVLALWPNARGEDGSQYRFTVATAAGSTVLDVLATVPDADCALAELTTTTTALPPWPAPDPVRQARLVQDVVDLLAESSPSAETVRKVQRWIALVLQICAAARPWKFAENLVETEIGPGVDQFDLTGAVFVVQKLWSRLGALTQLSLGAIMEARASANLHGGVNGGCPQWYALEGGRRLHLFPCPAQSEPLALLYQRPLTVDLIPPEMEFLIVNGVLGRYGRHFDRDALSQDPAEFEARFQRELPMAGRGSWDVATWSPNMRLLEPLSGVIPRVGQGQVQIGVPG